MSSMSESDWWYLFHEEVKNWDSANWFKIWQFQTPAKKLYLQMHLLAKRFIFLGWWSGFSERGNLEPSIWHQRRLFSPLSLHLQWYGAEFSVLWAHSVNQFYKNWSLFRKRRKKAFPPTELIEPSTAGDDAYTTTTTGGHREKRIKMFKGLGILWAPKREGWGFHSEQSRETSSSSQTRPRQTHVISLARMGSKKKNDEKKSEEEKMIWKPRGGIWCCDESLDVRKKSLRTTKTHKHLHLLPRPSQSLLSADTFWQKWSLKKMRGSANNGRRSETWLVPLSRRTWPCCDVCGFSTAISTFPDDLLPTLLRSTITVNASMCQGI